MLIWEYKKYKGLYIPEVLDQPKYNLVVGNRCSININESVPKATINCDDIDCTYCIYGVHNLPITLDYLIEIGSITKGDALDFSLMDVDIVEYDGNYEEN